MVVMDWDHHLHFVVCSSINTLLCLYLFKFDYHSLLIYANACFTYHSVFLSEISSVIPNIHYFRQILELNLCP